MSLRNNRASRLNRNMLFFTLLLGIIVLGCVAVFLYMAFQQPMTPQSPPEGDSVILTIDTLSSTLSI